MYKTKANDTRTACHADSRTIISHMTKYPMLECIAPGGGSRRVTPEQLAAGRRHLEATFLRLISTPDRDGLYWVGLQTDLLEVVYMVFVDQVVRDEAGTPMTLKCLVDRAFAVLHLYRPHNPYSLIARARRRKGIRRQTMLERYCWQKYVRGIDSPLDSEVVRISSGAEQAAAGSAAAGEDASAGPSPSAGTDRKEV